MYFMKLSDKRCGLHPSSRTSKGEKMPSRLYRPMLGICRQVTPYANVMKLGTVGLVGYLIALTAVGPGASTPCKPWSKCSLKNLGGRFFSLFLPKVGGGEVYFNIMFQLVNGFAM